MNLRELLIEYKRTSLELLEVLKSDLEASEKFLDIRENLLDKIKEMNFSKQEIVSISQELELVSIEKMITDEMNNIKSNIKDEIVQLKKQKDSIKVYGVNFKNVNFVNKQI